jgi:hypothetical protein
MPIRVFDVKFVVGLALANVAHVLWPVNHLSMDLADHHHRLDGPSRDRDHSDGIVPEVAWMADTASDYLTVPSVS